MLAIDSDLRTIAVEARTPEQTLEQVTLALAPLLDGGTAGAQQRVAVRLLPRPLDELLALFVEDLVELGADGFRPEYVSKLLLDDQGLRAAIEGRTVDPHARPLLRSVRVACSPGRIDVRIEIRLPPVERTQHHA